MVSNNVNGNTFKDIPRVRKRMGEVYSVLPRSLGTWVTCRFLEK